MRRRALTGALAAAATLAAPAAAIAQGDAMRVQIGPRMVGPHTSVLVSFRQPVRTGSTGSERSFAALVISGPSRSGCIGSRRIVLRAAPAGAMIRHRLRPRWLGGRWCTGTYDGRVTYQVQPACADPGPIREQEVACPMFIMVPRTLATFHFRVTAR